MLQEMSPSARKVWIEIAITVDANDAKGVTFREEGVDWNLNIDAMILDELSVTFREEGVDWNSIKGAYSSWKSVTFREEGVDWNLWCSR